MRLSRCPHVDLISETSLACVSQDPQLRSEEPEVDIFSGNTALMTLFEGVRLPPGGILPFCKTLGLFSG